MTMLFEGSPKFSGIGGDHARVAVIEGRVMIYAIDVMAIRSAAIAMMPGQARALAAGIVAAADNAEVANGWRTADPNKADVEFFTIGDFRRALRALKGDDANG